MLKFGSWAQINEMLIDLGIALGAEAIMAVPVMWAWNCVIPVLTKLPGLGYWQTFSTLFLLLIVKNTIWGNK